MKSAPPLPPLLDRLSHLRLYLQAVQDSLKLGVMPDLQGLDHRVAALCRDVEKVEGDGRARCRAELDALLRSLDTCRAGIVAWHAKGKADG